MEKVRANTKQGRTKILYIHGAFLLETNRCAGHLGPVIPFWFVSLLKWSRDPTSGAVCIARCERLMWLLLLFFQIALTDLSWDLFRVSLPQVWAKRSGFKNAYSKDIACISMYKKSSKKSQLNENEHTFQGDDASFANSTHPLILHVSHWHIFSVHFSSASLFLHWHWCCVTASSAQPFKPP